MPKIAHLDTNLNTKNPLPQKRSRLDFSSDFDSDFDLNSDSLFQFPIV